MVFNSSGNSFVSGKIPSVDYVCHIIHELSFSINVWIVSPSRTCNRQEQVVYTENGSEYCTVDRT